MKFMRNNKAADSDDGLHKNLSLDDWHTQKRPVKAVMMMQRFPSNTFNTMTLYWQY